MKRAIILLAALCAGCVLIWAGGSKEQAGTVGPPAPTPGASGSTSKPVGAAAESAREKVAPSEEPTEVDRKIGALTYLEGAVDVTRDGKRLGDALVAIGLDVENFDYVATASDGTAEMEITSPVSPGTILRVAPNTTFYLEVTRVGEATNSTEFTVLRGALGFKVKKITGNQEVLVRTDNSVLGVRGTDFRVVTSPTGDTLVTCGEGSVEISDGSKTARAEPGTVVEKLGDSPFRSVSVAVTSLDGFERAWYAERIEALKANALRATRAYAERYEQSAERFRAAFLSLVDDNAELLQKWVREDRAGTAGSTVEQMSEKKKVIGAIYRVERERYVLERLCHRLLELEGYHEQGTGRGEVRPGLSTGEFFSRFEADRGELEQDLHYLRYTMKLYARRNGGVFPGAVGADSDFEADGE